MQATSLVPDPGRRPVPLQLLERGGHREVVRLEQAGVTGQCPPDAQRLRRREGGVEPGHRLHHSPIGRLPILQHHAERRSGDRVAALQQPLQVVGFDPTGQAEPTSLAARPIDPAPPRARRRGSGCSRPPWPRPRRRRGWSPAASDTTARYGHLSVDHREVLGEAIGRRASSAGVEESQRPGRRAIVLAVGEPVDGSGRDPDGATKADSRQSVGAVGVEPPVGQRVRGGARDASSRAAPRPAGTGHVARRVTPQPRNLRLCPHPLKSSGTRPRSTKRRNLRCGSGPRNHLVQRGADGRSWWCPGPSKPGVGK